MAEGAAPADAAKRAALAGEFGKVYNGCSLRTPVQQQLVAYFAGRGGESVADVRQLLVVEKSNEQGWMDTWESALEEAGVTSAFDAKLFLRWARARSDGGGGAVLGNAQAKRALDVLLSSGVNVTPELRADLEGVLARGEAGTEKEQCCCPLAHCSSLQRRILVETSPENWCFMPGRQVWASRRSRKARYCSQRTS